MKKSLMAGLAAATVMFAVPAAAQVQFTGTTTGCFGAACAPTLAATSLGGLAFTGGSFNQATDNTGFLALGGESDGLGTFNLSGTPFDYNGAIFRLLVTFSVPNAVVGNGTFSSLLEGRVTGVNSGGVSIDFDNTANSFTSSSGPFTLRINDVGVSSNSSTQIVSGVIRAAVPEPGTWGMMLVGFGAIGYSMRRRRKSILQVA